VFCHWLSATALWLILFALTAFGCQVNYRNYAVFRTVFRTAFCGVGAVRRFTVLYGVLRCFTVLTVSCGAVRCRTELGPSVGPCIARCLYGVGSVNDVLSAPPSALPRCASQLLDRGAQANARGATQLLDRGAQAVARCVARCASLVLDRGAQAVSRSTARSASQELDLFAQAAACGTTCCASQVLGRGAQAVARGAATLPQQEKSNSEIMQRSRVNITGLDLNSS